MKIFDNFLNTVDLHKIESYVNDSLNSTGWQSSQDFYNHEIGGILPKTITPYLFEIEGNIKEFLLKIFKDKNIIKEPAFFVCLIQNASPLSSIDWHTDTHLKYEDPSAEDPYDVVGITIYLNKFWDPNWGGFFCRKTHKDDEEGIFIQPKYNRAVINTGLEPHAVSPLSSSADNRISIQVFVDRENVVKEYLQ